LDETVVDLEASNHRCIQLGSELKQKSSEVDALRVFKIMARQADIREDALRVMVIQKKQGGKKKGNHLRSFFFFFFFFFFF
jgi:hypothetical protein